MPKLLSYATHTSIINLFPSDTFNHPKMPKNHSESGKVAPAPLISAYFYDSCNLATEQDNTIKMHYL